MSVRFVLDVRTQPGSRNDLLRAYAAIRARVSQEPGLISHQLCQSTDDPERWLITSEWQSLEASSRWDRSDEHDRLTGPLRACFASASSTKLEVLDGVHR